MLAIHREIQLAHHRVGQAPGEFAQRFLQAGHAGQRIFANNQGALVGWEIMAIVF